MIKDDEYLGTLKTLDDLENFVMREEMLHVAVPEIPVLNTTDSLPIFVRRGEEGIAVVDEEATVIMHNETITPTSPPHHSLIMNQSANLLKALEIVSKSMI